MPDVYAPPDYRQSLPVELTSQADAFIRYLHELPNKSPVACPECGHPRFKLEARQNLRLPFYRCVACNKGFNCLSKTPFSRFGLMHLWSTYGQYLLAGWPMPVIANAMGISPSTTWRWIKPCRAVMAKKFPELYHWWSARQDRTNLKPPAHIAIQAQAFLSGLEQLLSTQQAACSSCWSTVSLLHGTLLSRLGYPEH
jgi:transposase-like protein